MHIFVGDGALDVPKSATNIPTPPYVVCAYKVLDKSKFETHPGYTITFLC